MKHPVRSHPKDKPVKHKKIKPTIISLCDYSGIWSKPYLDAGFKVIQVDLKHGHDARTFRLPKNDEIYGVIAQPVCTHFAGSGARWWDEKGDEPVKEGLALVDACIRVMVASNWQMRRRNRSLVFSVLENPVGRLHEWLGESHFRFHPHQYGGYMNPPHDFEAQYHKKWKEAGEDRIKQKQVVDWAMQWDAYTKKTCLWGRFNLPKTNPVPPVLGSTLWARFGGKSERTKEQRSMTPKGFAQAFFNANSDPMPWANCHLDIDHPEPLII